MLRHLSIVCCLIGCGKNFSQTKERPEQYESPDSEDSEGKGPTKVVGGNPEDEDARPPTRMLPTAKHPTADTVCSPLEEYRVVCEDHRCSGDDAHPDSDCIFEMDEKLRECTRREMRRQDAINKACNRLINHVRIFIFKMSWGTKLYKCVQPNDQHLRDFAIRHHVYRWNQNYVSPNDNQDVDAVFHNSRDKLEYKRDFLHWSYRIQSYYQADVDRCSND